MTLETAGQGTSKEIRPRKSLAKATMVLIALAGLFFLVHNTPIRRHLQDFRSFNDSLASCGVMAPVVFVGAVSVLVAAGCPRLIFCPVAGMAFGFWAGLLWSQLATVLGCYLNFILVRWGGRDFVLRHWARAGKLHLFFGEHGVLSVIVIRQLPLPSVLLNVVFGLSPVRQRDYILGTLIGILPEAVPCTLMGSGAMQGSFGQGAWRMGLAIGMLIAVWVGIGIIMKVSRVAEQARELDQTIEPEES